MQGADLRMVAGVSESFHGGLSTYCFPSTGCSTEVTTLRASTCGFSRISEAQNDGIAAAPADCSVSMTSMCVNWIVHAAIPSLSARSPLG